MAFRYHEGELHRQQIAHASEAAELNAGGVHEWMPPVVEAFIADQPFIAVGHHDADGGVWASILHGPRGFVHAMDEQTVVIDARPAPGDALGVSLAAAGDAGQMLALGMIAIEPATRRRVRLNGDAHLTDAGQIVVHLEQVFGNCPKYIATRTPDGEPGSGADVRHGTERSALLTDAHRGLVTAADTFFIASAHTGTGADVSHRGGRPGFITVSEDGARLTWPDYRGNSMFMTLGNLDLDPAAGLVIPDWENADLLQVRGRAYVDDAPERAAAFPRAERVVDLEVEEVVMLRGALGERWTFGEPSKVSPPVAAAAG